MTRTPSGALFRAPCGCEYKGTVSSALHCDAGHTRPERHYPSATPVR